MPEAAETREGTAERVSEPASGHVVMSTNAVTIVAMTSRAELRVPASRTIVRSVSPYSIVGASGP